MRKRVTVQKHRLAKHDRSGSTRLGSFSRESAHLHKQALPSLLTAPPAIIRRSCCDICSRQSGPSIFEVVSQEESPVLALEGWQLLDGEELLNLYGEAFGWKCCQCQRRESDVAWQQGRKSQWMKGRYGTAREALFGGPCARWDPLG